MTKCGQTYYSGGQRLGEGYICTPQPSSLSAFYTPLVIITAQKHWPSIFWPSAWLPRHPFSWSSPGGHFAPSRHLSMRLSNSCRSWSPSWCSWSIHLPYRQVFQPCLQLQGPVLCQGFICLLLYPICLYCHDSKTAAGGFYM
jgi:hypothetical protein